MHLPLPLYFFLNILAKQSGRFYQKHNDQNCKYNSISHLGRNIGFTKDFDNPQQYTTNPIASTTASKVRILIVKPAI